MSMSERGGRSDLVDISCTVKNLTERAVLIDDGTRQVWLPLALVEVDHQPLKASTVTLPEWLAKERGLI